MNWEIRINISTQLCIKKVTNEKLLYSTENSTWCSVVTEMGKKSITRMCMYLWVIYFYGQQKLTQRYKAAILQ